MHEPLTNSYTSFHGPQRIAAGSLQTNALAVKRAHESGAAGAILIFEDASGRAIDVDLSGSDEALLARLAVASAGAAQPAMQEQAAEAAAPRGRGRPKLGVVAREVTLLPRHWEWLAEQPGGASVALRKLVEEARRTHSEKDAIRQAHERAYHFMQGIAGDLPHFEEATRALFAGDSQRFRTLIAAWPVDIREHAVQLALHD